MLKKIKWIVTVIFVLALVFAFKPSGNYFEIAKSLDIFATLFKEVNTYYVDEVDPNKLIREGIDGVLESLDPYTVYIAEEELENFRITTTGQYAGIGALISLINKKIIVTHPYKDFPAFKSGIKVGDEIVAVNGKGVSGMMTPEVSTLLKGPAKTEVEVRVKRVGEKNDLTFKIRRERISISALVYSGMVHDGIGYIKLDDFTPGASKEVSAAIQKLKSEGATKLILDLRDNPGGLLHEAVNIANLFIPKGKEVVSTKGKVEEWNKWYKTLGNPMDIEIPLIILIGEGSASASEIVAGSLQDYDRAVLAGGKTFGKGLVQTTRQLSYNTQLKVTTAKYYIPSGRCIQKFDYEHRAVDGTVKAYADSLKAEFRTLNGRKVYDGGGLDPDIIIDQDYAGEITAALFGSGLIFEYATKYCSEHAAPSDFKNFKLSDKEYSTFTGWVKTQNFTYETSLENEIKQLMAGKNEKYFPLIESDLKSLSAKIESNKSQDLLRFQDEINYLLAQQIAFHYGLSEAQNQVSITGDKAIAEAIDVLSSSTRYKAILSIK